MYEKFEELLRKNNVTPYRVHKETGISTATLSDWKNGKSNPKKDKIEKICEYFNVPLSYFYGDNTEGGEKYYLNGETAQIAQEIFENKDLRMLFDVTKNASPQRLKAYYNMIKELEKQENHGED